MAVIEYTPTYHNPCLVLNKEEARRIQPLILKAVAKERETRHEYQDRIDSGYASTMEENLMIKHDDAYRELKTIADEIEHLINY